MDPEMAHSGLAIKSLRDQEMAHGSVTTTKSKKESPDLTDQETALGSVTTTKSKKESPDLTDQETALGSAMTTKSRKKDPDQIDQEMVLLRNLSMETLGTTITSKMAIHGTEIHSMETLGTTKLRSEITNQPKKNLPMLTKLARLTTGKNSTKKVA